MQSYHGVYHGGCTDNIQEGLEQPNNLPPTLKRTGRQDPCKLNCQPTFLRFFGRAQQPRPTPRQTDVAEKRALDPKTRPPLQKQHHHPRLDGSPRRSRRKHDTRKT